MTLLQMNKIKMVNKEKDYIRFEIEEPEFSFSYKRVFGIYTIEEKGIKKEKKEFLFALTHNKDYMANFLVNCLNSKVNV